MLLPCRTEDPDLWFPIGDRAEPLAIELCGLCPIKQECLAVALERGEYGIWGGTTDQERAVMARRTRGFIDVTPQRIRFHKALASQ